MTQDSKSYNAGFNTIQLLDTSRIYKPNSQVTDRLHYRPIDLDVWYPSSESVDGKEPLRFGNLFQLYEDRANKYQNETDYTGLVEELAQFFVAQLGIEGDGRRLLEVVTDSYQDLKILEAPIPLIIYMAGINGMGFENYKLLEDLAENGYVVVSISSNGRYPADMTNELGDTMEQVYDAEFALNYLKTQTDFHIDYGKIGVIGTSWGGMSGAILLNRSENIKALVSLDGSDTHFYGDYSDNNRYANDATWEDNDRFIKEIYDAEFTDIEKQKFAYLYLESGDKLNDFTPTDEYQLHKELESNAKYLRFKQSEHADFTCIPSILSSSKKSIAVHEQIQNTTVGFLNQVFKGTKEFDVLWNNYTRLEETTTEPYDIANLSPKVTEFGELLGRIVDAKTDLPLSYVNVGILNREVGTVTDSLGNFNLNVLKEFSNDTVRISMIGYEPIELILGNIVKKKDTLKVRLKEQISELNEVVVSAKAFKRRTLGNKTESKFISTGFGYNQLGAEMGIKINIRKNPTFVDAFNFTVSQNRLSAKSIFRLNFYEVNKRKPGNNILKDNILVAIEPKQTGKMTIDLKPYDIVLKEDVIATLEWVANEGENKKDEAIFFPIGFFTSGTLRKETSQSRFKKFASLGIGFNIDVRYY
ncbi:carboxypeptidase-like regulatory domain-containing protein [Ulvibacterium marinum]|nr:carboxypeptidase-like regulatory domain-containing protein [Ulvibacterium marinum]